MKDQDAPSRPLTVMIPAYNEVDTIEHTLTRVLDVPMVGEVIVVNDGSDDGTGELLDRFEDPRVQVLHHPRRMGKGWAIRTAIPHITGEIVVVQDADMEYEPHQLPRLAQPILRGEASVVYGSRFRGTIQGMRLANWIGNRLLTQATNLLFGSHITDEATCYKMFRSDLLKSMPLRCIHFEFCPEVTARVLRDGIRIVEEPIDYHARPHAAGKKIRWWDFVSALLTLTRYRVFR